MDDLPTLESYHIHEQEWDSYDALRDAFEWQIPDEFNMADYVVDRWGNRKGDVAIFQKTPDDETTYTFWQLAHYTDQLANHFESLDIGVDDRVGVYLDRKPETAIAHVSCWKTGAESVPLSPLFGPEGLAYRLDDSDATACIVDESTVGVLQDVVDELDELEHVLVVTENETPAVGNTNVRNFWETVADNDRSYENVSRSPADPAMVFYTSGTTGEPKGVVLQHSILLGYLPLFQVTFCNMEIGENDLFWIPADWAWIASLFNILFPAWFFGKPVFAHRNEGFDPETAFEMIEEYGVTVYHTTPTALRMMMQVDYEPYERESVRLIVLGGETVGESVIDWGTTAFPNARVNIGYGQTEANMLMGFSDYFFEYRSGTIGKPAPGQDISLLDTTTAEATIEPGEIGEIATRYGDNPVAFAEYLNEPEKTAQKVKNGWLLTEDLGRVDEDGFYYFEGRTDDVIISSGYKIGPGEIEDCLAEHEAVADAGVIGVPDDQRGEIPKAFVQLIDREPSPALRDELKDYVRRRLAKHEYPRELEFIDELPKTTTGKIRRYELRKREGLA